MDYAIIKTGGKQYRVSSGDVIDVERLTAEEGAKVELTDVLLLSEGGNVLVGTPAIQGAKVVAEVEKHLRGEKIEVFRYKAKTRHRSKIGHRQELTRLKITDIVTDSAPRRRRRRQARESTEEKGDGS